jgi:hypothetical protein
MFSAFNQFWYFSYSVISFGIGKYGAFVYWLVFSVNGFPECLVVTVVCQLEAQAVEKMVLLAVSVYVILLSPNLWSTVVTEWFYLLAKTYFFVLIFWYLNLGKCS